MNDKVFLDTNILIYSLSKDKNEIIFKIIDESEQIYISTQVVNEFINTVLKKKIVNINEIDRM